MDRRRLLRDALLALPAARVAQGEPLRLEETALTDLDRGFRENRLTARSLAEWYLARIDSLDKKGPKVNAVIEINSEALQIADALDRERSAGHVRGPLHGVPVLIKDNL